jgi:putative heme-binding domain-containing protein
MSRRSLGQTLTRIAGGLMGLLAGMAARADDGPRLTVEPGQHIAIVGNTLAERMQHQGWLETLLHTRFPSQKLVVRNLAFPGDEIDLRLRSANFGTPDAWLKRVEADVIFAFFGANEAWDGPSGVEPFKASLREFINHTGTQAYRGDAKPQIVLFTTIAHENLKNPHLPDGQAHNANLALYAQAIQAVGQETGTPVVDLFGPSQALFASSNVPLTSNGIHLTEDGERLLSPEIVRQLFPNGPMVKLDAAALDRIHAAVLDKNFHWFHRYRTTDGYSIFGGRADLKFVNDQTNREVAQREMEVLDAMTANRDQRIWAVAAGKNTPVDDSNLPPFIPVLSNMRGDRPDGSFTFLSGEAAIGKMTVHPELQVNLFADEAMFPALVEPVQIAFDTKGRLFVAAWASYPHWKPTEPMDDKLLILEDTDGDGRADRCKTFAGGLHNPTGFEFWGKGLIVAQTPDIVYLEDTDGDDVADVRKRLLSGIDSADTHHTSNSFVLGPGGDLYFQEGTFHHSQIETPWGPPVRQANAGIFRFEPRTLKVSSWASHPFANPHGHVIDAWGQGIVHDGTGAQPYHTTLMSGRTTFPAKHPTPPPVYPQRTRPCPGTEILSSPHFPESMQGRLLVGNVIGFQGILQYRVSDAGSSFTAVEAEPILSSSDPNFRPVDFEVAPDGSLYFTDWQNPIIGHMQHNLRDPNRDRAHGRVYRVTAKGRPLLTPEPIAGQPVPVLLDRLKSPMDRVRYRARIELSGRPATEVLPALTTWLAGLKPDDPAFEHHRLEGLWLRQSFDEPDAALLNAVLKSPEPRARAAAVRVLAEWRDRVPSVLDRLRDAAADESPRVRLEALRAASFLDDPAAIEVVAIESSQPTDRYLDYLRGETRKVLDPIWKGALARGADLATTSPAGEQFLLANMTLEALLKRPRTEAVCTELLTRPDVRDEARREAADTLAKLHSTTAMAVALDAISRLDRSDSPPETVLLDLARLVAGLPVPERAASRPSLEQLATAARSPMVRQAAFVSLVSVDGQADRAWALAGRSPESLADLVRAVPLIGDASTRASFYDRVLPLLNALPAPMAEAVKARPTGPVARFVRIELPRRGTLTLAEVEVWSGGRNIARAGRASQKNTASGGLAERAIDGNADPEYNSGTQTHTEENTANPWWEVDLGQPRPVEKLVVHNRKGFERRLEGFTVRLLGNDRSVVATIADQPAPKLAATIPFDPADPSLAVRHAAMDALTSIRGHESDVFRALVPFVGKDSDRVAAVRALQRLPRAAWPADAAPGLVATLTAVVRATPVADRTAPATLDALQLADDLAGLLPADQAKAARADLRGLGVRVIRLGTLLERMSYDKDTLAVAAGKPVEFVFENSDLMPHNLVITRPGALESVGLLAESTAQQADAAARQYVPPSDQILLASKLLQNRQSQRLPFTAPSEPGVYPYVCTYPGHWRRMFGALYVVADLDAYLADPVAYLAANPLPIKDTLLEQRRPRTEWTLADLEPALAALEPGSRTFGNGRQMFAVGTCISCHKVGDQGQAFGPDLAALDPKKTPLEVLQSLLEPSATIEDKYRPVMLELESGQIVSGLVVKETDTVIELVENPVASAQPRSIDKRQVVDRANSTSSIMPKGLLDPLTRDEILDLLAFLIARGDPKHPIYQAPAGAGPAGSHQHGH